MTLVLRGKSRVELDRVELANLGQLRILHPAVGTARVDRAGDDDQAAVVLIDPIVEQIDLLGREELPIGIEGDDAVVFGHLRLRGGELA